MRIFVLIFNAGTDNEGIHSIRKGDRNTIMMFESEDDATRFGLMLEAQDFPTPSVEGMEDEDIKEFCQGADFDWEIVPANGSGVITPPELNVDQTDWKPEGKTEDSQETPQEMSDSDLDSIRRRLEGLL